MLKNYFMYERALKIIEGQYDSNVYQYYEASKTAYKMALENYERFQSSHEMAAAIELISKNINFSNQEIIKKHKVDFCLPNEKIILEIDGYMHTKGRKPGEVKRDIEIRKELGEEWEVIRIKTENIEEGLQFLYPALINIKNMRNEIRKIDKIIVPEKYTLKQLKNYWDKIKNKKSA